VNASAGHLSVHVEGAHPVDVPFLFEQPEKRIGGAFVASAVWHAVMFLVAFLVFRYGGRAVSVTFAANQPNNQIVWLNQPGPGGGGGGGGNRMKEPPRQAELPGKEQITVPVEKPKQIEPPQVAKNEPPEQLNIPAMTLAAAKDNLPGAIDAPPGPPTL